MENVELNLFGHVFLATFYAVFDKSLRPFQSIRLSALTVALFQQLYCVSEGVMDVLRFMNVIASDSGVSYTFR